MMVVFIILSDDEAHSGINQKLKNIGQHGIAWIME